MFRPTTAIVCLAALAASPVDADDVPVAFRIEAPRVALQGVPVAKVEISAVDDEGNVVGSFAGTPTIHGVVLVEQGAVVEPAAFVAGRLTLQTDAAAGRKVFVVHRKASGVEVELEGVRTRKPVAVLAGWLALLPPLVAIALAVALRQVLVALFVGVLSGTLVLTLGHPVEALGMALSDFVLQAIVDPDGGAYSHMHVILFTTFLGSMVAVMFESGGTHALVATARPLLKTRERTQLGTALLGLVVFFDDYANTLLVGTTMRPVTDGQRISRAKLAFLVDATAAPIAGLAVVSTWVGFEVGLIAEAYSDLGLEADAYGTFLATLPYRFYPILLLAFVFANAATGRDFGPMRLAENRALVEAAEPAAVPVEDVDVPERPRLVNALLPLGLLLGGIAFGLWWTGWSSLAAANAEAIDAGRPAEAVTLGSVLSNADSYVVLLYASFAASVVAIGSAVVTRASSLAKATDAWVDGVKQMLPAVLVLVLAWALAAVCAPENLNTAGFLVETTTGWVSAAWMPMLAFLLAAAVSFATGTSWATMGLLIPLFVPYVHDLLLGDSPSVDPYDPILLGTVGAVLAGSIFGDHCSPISDTTVLSSASAGCEHLEHVGTQMPYALVVAAVAVLTGSLPLAVGVSPWIGLVVGLASVVAVVRFAGRKPTTG